MKLRGILIVLAAVLLVSGCGSSISTNYDYDVNAPFIDYKTFDWMPKPAAKPGNAATAIEQNDLLDKRIKNAISDALAGKGVKKSTDSPDLLVVYYVNVQDKVQVTDWGYRYSDYYWGWGGREIDVYNYKEGTLIIDLIDAGSKNLIWRGAGQKALDEGNRTPEQQDATIRKVVGAIMEKYPPKR